jgi:hypothetical protein
MRRGVVIARNAPDTVAKLAAPAVYRAAGEIAHTVPAHVPVNQGVVVRLYRRLRADKQDDGSSRVVGFPPLWHWLEFGTRWNMPYRPIENAVRALGLKFDGSR